MIKSLDGRVVAFGFKIDKFKSVLNSNNKILSFDVLNGITKQKGKVKYKDKTINIEKIRKIYKKKSIDYILIDVDIIDKYMIYLIKETIYIGKKLYLFGNAKKVEYYIKKYKRYNIDVENKNVGNNKISKINIKNAKNNKIKDKIYIIKDKAENIIQLLSDALVS